MKKIYTPQEIARLLGVVPTTIYAELQRGKLPHSRVGRKYIITRQHLKQYLSPEVFQELIAAEEMSQTGLEEADWIDRAAADMAKGIAIAEQDVPEEELAAWLKAMEKAVKPLEMTDSD